MQEAKKYSKYVIRAILSGKTEKISEVTQLACVSSSLFEKEAYLTLLNRLKNGKAQGLPTEIKHTGNAFREYLYVYNFVDQEGKRWFVTIYDSDELINYISEKIIAPLEAKVLELGKC